MNTFVKSWLVTVEMTTKKIPKNRLISDQTGAKHAVFWIQKVADKGGKKVGLDELP